MYLSLPRHKLLINDRSANAQARGIERAVRQFQSAVAAETKANGSTVTVNTLEKKAEFFGGRFVVKKFQHGPIELDLPKLIDDFKRLARKLL